MSMRDELRQQDQIKEALQRYSKEELIDMLAHLMKAYVIDGVNPQKPDVGRIHIPHHLRELSFPALLETLQFHLDLPELQKFNVVDSEVYVKLGEREYSLDGPAPPSRAAVAPQPPAARAPAAEGAVPRDSAPPPPAKKKAAEPPPPVSDRFRMLELD